MRENTKRKTQKMGNLKKIVKKENKIELILIDGMSMVYKYFYAMSALKNKKGELTGLFHGFLSLVLSKESCNSRLVVCWEGGHLIRKELMKSYKSQRKTKPDAMEIQISKLKYMLGLMGIEQKFMPGYEADDVAGVLSRTSNKILFISGDKDWFQLMKKDCIMLYRGKELTYSEVEKQEEFPPKKIILYKMMKGDISDNIKGIPQFPTQLAKEITRNCNSLAEIYKYTPDKPADQKWITKLRESKKDNKLRMEILTIKRKGILEDLPVPKKNINELKRMLLEMELFKVLNLLNRRETTCHTKLLVR